MSILKRGLPGNLVAAMEACDALRIIHALTALVRDTTKQGIGNPSRWLSHFGGLESSSSGKSITPLIEITYKGNVVNSCIDGCIQMKSYLRGNPELRLVLNEDLMVGKSSYGSSLAVDDIIFHSCVGISEFESNKVLTMHAPDGEFTVMNYRITKYFQISK